MLQGKTYDELIPYLDKREQRCADYIVNSEIISVSTKQQSLSMTFQGIIALTPSETAHSQIASKLGIPKVYYDRMRRYAPQLLVDNIHCWFSLEPKDWMLRTLDGSVLRAFLSNRYRRINDSIVVKMVIDACFDRRDQPYPLHMDVTDNFVHITMLYPTEYEIEYNRTVKVGFTFRNSEVGLGSLILEPFFYRSYCKNGCIFGKREIEGLRVRHLGPVVAAENYYKMTDHINIDGLEGRLKDSISALSNPPFIGSMINSLREANQSMQLAKPEETLEFLAKEFGLTEQQKSLALENFLDEGNYSKWGVCNAFTSLANTAKDADEQLRLMQVGQKVLNIGKRPWERLTQN